MDWCTQNGIRILTLSFLIFGKTIFALESMPTGKIRIAIIDTGADLSIPLIQKSLWTNPREIPNNRVDDDNNGFIDDINGWNFADHSNSLIDENGHGTHIAGLVLSNSTPIEIMILKYYSASSNNMNASLNAIKYAIQNNANIINYSGGGSEYSDEEYSLIQQAERKGILFVAAAGNDSQDLIKHPFYPANYFLSNIITVGAFDRKGELLKYSNFNLRQVDLAALGENVFSTLPSNKNRPGLINYGKMTGTSQATALVSSALAAFWYQTKNRVSAVEIKHRFLASSPREVSLLGKVKKGAYLPINESQNISLKD